MFFFKTTSSFNYGRCMHVTGKERLSRPLDPPTGVQKFAGLTVHRHRSQQTTSDILDLQPLLITEHPSSVCIRCFGRA